MPVWLQSLLHDPKFYAALLALVQALVFYFLPDFPENIWLAISVFAGVIFAAMAGQDANTARNEAKAEAAQRG